MTRTDEKQRERWGMRVCMRGRERERETKTKAKKEKCKRNIVP